METRKRTPKNIENGAPNGNPEVYTFWSPGSFFCARRPWEPKRLPRLLPRAPGTSPSLDFHRFRVDLGWFFYDFPYHLGYFLSGLPNYFFGYLELYFQSWLLFWLPRGFIFKKLPTSSHVLGPSLGVSKVKKMRCGPQRFFGVVSRVIGKLRSPARWREGRRPLRFPRGRLSWEQSILSGRQHRHHRCNLEGGGFVDCCSRMHYLSTDHESSMLDACLMVHSS